MTTTHSKSTERPASTANGLLMLLLGLLLIVGGPVVVALNPESVLQVVGGVVTALLGLLLLCGLYALQPNEGMAILLFGDYRGTDRKTGLRDLASHYAYDHGEEHELTLRADAEDVAARLRDELAGRVSVAGLTVDEARLAHLAYAPEIASAMLKRQQAEAVLAARRLIVKGAVGMVENALTDLGERGVVELDEDRKAAMVSNLLVVLCADREAQPVVNTGTLYG